MGTLFINKTSILFSIHAFALIYYYTKASLVKCQLLFSSILKVFTKIMINEPIARATNISQMKKYEKAIVVIIDQILNVYSFE